jgi:hypothetical protein
VRRLAHEAADAGLLSPDLAAGIARVKGVKQLGQRSGNRQAGLCNGGDLLKAASDAVRGKEPHTVHQDQSGPSETDSRLLAEWDGAA